MYSGTNPSGAPMLTKLKSQFIFAMILISFIVESSGVLASDVKFLGLSDAIKMAQKKDPWLKGDLHRQQALESLSIAAAELPDPMLSLSFQNLPVDTFDFGQEPMTQFKLSLSQQFPRGDSRSLRKRRLEWQANQHPHLRVDRRARLSVIVSELWFDVYLAQQSIKLIETDRYLFEQLVDITQASYTSALGNTRQQDIVRAQLELTRLEDRLISLELTRAVTRRKLSEWVNEVGDDMPGTNLSALRLPDELPTVTLTSEKLFKLSGPDSSAAYLKHFANHPGILAIVNKIRASDSEVALAREQYKPAWSINASYAYKDSVDPTGQSRPDLFSIGVSLYMPLFVGKRQDKNLEAAISRREAVKTERWLLIRNIIASYESHRARLIWLDRRRALYRSQLLPQALVQMEASLNAYTNDSGDFPDVVRSRIDQLNSRIEMLEIEVERRKTMFQLNYLTVTGVDSSGVDSSGVDSSGVASSEKKEAGHEI